MKLINKKFLRHKNIKHIFLTALCLIALPESMLSINLRYKTYDILFDQPAGELQYYTVHTEGYVSKTASNDPSRYEWNEFSRDYDVPVVFTDDGKVFFKNLYQNSSYNYPVWMEGRINDNDIIFENNSIIRYSLRSAIWELDPDISQWITPEMIIGRTKPALLFYENSKLFIQSYESSEPITFKGESDGTYNLILPSNEGLYVTFDRDVVTKCNVKPSSTNYVIPPSNIKEEDFQINFIPFAMECLSYPEIERWESLRLKVIRTDKEIYIKGLSRILSGNHDAWVKGDIIGDKVVFKNGCLFGVDMTGKPMYFTPMNVENEPKSKRLQTRVDGIRHEKYFNATEQDLIFDYDAKTGKLSNPTSDFGFTVKPNLSWVQSWGTEDNSLMFIDAVDFFGQAEILKIPDNYKFKPMGPYFDKPSINNPNDNITYRISYLDENGYMMDPERIYISIFDNGEPKLYNYVDYKDLTETSSYYYPFFNNYLTCLFELDGVGFNICNMKIWGSLPKDSNKKIVVYYIGEDYVSSSDNTANIETITTDNYYQNHKEIKIYDLNGRKINSDINNLSPGIYIINGKKVKI